MYKKGRFHREKNARQVRKIGNQRFGLTVAFSPQDDVGQKLIRTLLREAKQSIDIAMFFLKEKGMVRDLIRAHRKGVKVRVILDATAAANGYSKHEILRAAGIPVKVENWGGKMHMKSAVIDGHHVVTGSMNWTRSGTTRNDENTVILHSPKHAREYLSFYEELWNSIPEELLKSDVEAESLASGHSCADGLDNDHDGQIDKDDPGCRKQGTLKVADLPVWIESKGENKACYFPDHEPPPVSSRWK